MKKTITIILIAISLSSYAQDSFNFTAEITDLRSNAGNIRIEIFDENKKVIQTTIAEIIDQKAHFEITGLNKATYAIRYFHDENSDKEFGTNFIGIPNEGFGYSNNAKGMFGEPDFKDWLFHLDGNKSLHLKAYYLL
jgi:uncharacterized protein (DUF2141 family)